MATESYICLNCRFRFRASKNPNSCPYCDKKILEKEQAASDLVDEVSSLLQEN